jgi:tRNA A37 threonylcarbamoyladenosine synthetase subunit TsaC/SUA5/YrdC
LQNLVYLIQTDTTVGFASQNLKKLNAIKKSNTNKKLIKTYCCFKEAIKDIRVPKRFKKLIRKANKTTFIYPDNIARRVVKEGNYQQFLEKFKWMYSTSANISGKDIDINWAKEKADVVVFDKDGFKTSSASKIFKITKKKLVKIR